MWVFIRIMSFILLSVMRPLWTWSQHALYAMGKIINIWIRILIVVCFDLQRMCHNIWWFAKSRSKLSLWKRKTMWTNKHSITWDFQNAIWTCIIASCTTSTFDTLVRYSECCRFTFSTSKIRRWAYEG